MSACTKWGGLGRSSCLHTVRHGSSRSHHGSYAASNKMLGNDLRLLREMAWLRLRLKLLLRLLLLVRLVLLVRLLLLLLEMLLELGMLLLRLKGRRRLGIGAWILVIRRYMVSSARQGLLVLLLGGLEVGDRRVGADDGRGDGQLVRLELLLVKLLLEMLLLLLLDMLLLLQRVVVGHGRLVHGWLSRLALGRRVHGRQKASFEGEGEAGGKETAAAAESGRSSQCAWRRASRVSAAAGWDLLDVDWAAGEVEVWPPGWRWTFGRLAYQQRQSIAGGRSTRDVVLLLRGSFSLAFFLAGLLVRLARPFCFFLCVFFFFLLAVFFLVAVAEIRLFFLPRSSHVNNTRHVMT